MNLELFHPEVGFWNRIGKSFFKKACFLSFVCKGSLVNNMGVGTWVTGKRNPTSQGWGKGAESQVRLNEMANKLLNSQEFAFISLSRVVHWFYFFFILINCTHSLAMSIFHTVASRPWWWLCAPQQVIQGQGYTECFAAAACLQSHTSQVNSSSVLKCALWP